MTYNYERLIIGDGSVLGGGVSTVTYFKRSEKEIQEHVSANSQLFWVKSKLFDFDYWIMKDTEEGEVLQSMLDNKDIESHKIIDYIDEIVLKHLDVYDIQRLIAIAKNEAFIKGELSIKRKFKDLIS
jgi:hypothetical protein